LKKIYSNFDSYSLVSSDSVYEKDYENQIRRYSDKLFPDFYCVKFNAKVNSVFGNCIPDLALIHKDYKDWYVVEVELEHHSLSHHVLDQIRSMHHGEYGESHVEYLLQQEALLDESKLRQLVRQQPHTLIIVPFSKISWRESLYQYQTRIMTVQVWRNEKRETLLQVDGDDLRQYSQEFVSDLEVDPGIPRLLKVKNIASIPDNGLLQIEISGSKSDWRIQNFGSGKWLNPDGKSPLPENSKGVFSLTRMENGEYLMEVKK
jgi:hypothetical protein